MEGRILIILVLFLPTVCADDPTLLGNHVQCYPNSKTTLSRITASCLQEGVSSVYVNRDPAVHRCTNHCTDFLTGVTTITGGYPSWGNDRYCQSECVKPIGSIEAPYTISVDVKSVHGEHVGIMYNMQDKYNYAAFHFRLLHPDNCYQSGECVRDGIYTYRKSLPCPSGPPATGYWFNVTAEVSERSVVVRLNGEVVHTESPCFPLVARGGVAAPNGYSNVVTYQKCIISF